MCLHRVGRRRARSAGEGNAQQRPVRRARRRQMTVEQRARAQVPLAHRAGRHAREKRFQCAPEGILTRPTVRCGENGRNSGVTPAERNRRPSTACADGKRSRLPPSPLARSRGAGSARREYAPSRKADPRGVELQRRCEGVDCRAGTRDSSTSPRKWSVRWRLGTSTQLTPRAESCRSRSDNARKCATAPETAARAPSSRSAAMNSLMAVRRSGWRIDERSPGLHTEQDAPRQVERDLRGELAHARPAGWEPVRADDPHLSRRHPDHDRAEGLVVAAAGGSGDPRDANPDLGRGALPDPIRHRERHRLTHRAPLGEERRRHAEHRRSWPRCCSRRR